MPSMPPAKFSLVLPVAMLALAGCHEYVNPWVDEYPGPEAVTTASVTGIRERGTTPELRQRTHEPMTISPQDGTVPHFPLWWEDAFESEGSDDGQFAVTWEDYLAMPWSYGRMHLNTIALPYSAVVQPPVPHMGSDGVLSPRAFGEEHDAEWLGARGTPLPPDIVELGEVPTPPNGPAPEPAAAQPAVEPMTPVQ